MNMIIRDKISKNQNKDKIYFDGLLKNVIPSLKKLKALLRVIIIA